MNEVVFIQQNAAPAGWSEEILTTQQPAGPRQSKRIPCKMCLVEFDSILGRTYCSNGCRVKSEKMKAKAHRENPQISDKYKKTRIKYESNNKQKISERKRAHYLKNRQLMIKKSGEYTKERRSRDVSFRVWLNIRCRVSKFFKKSIGGDGAEKLFGCTPQFFRNHIQSLWKRGMSWENYGVHGWHLDHIKPLSCFDANSPQDIFKASHYSNFQPLWAKDNLRKSDKWHGS
jgi:hypothetical protein